MDAWKSRINLNLPKTPFVSKESIQYFGFNTAAFRSTLFCDECSYFQSEFENELCLKKEAEQ